MSRFDYRCASCAEVHEENHAIGSAPTESACPSCGNLCQRVFSPRSDQLITPARWGVDKAGIREVTGGHSMNDIRHDGELRRRYIG